MIIGHKKQWKFFASKIKNGQLAHAYLFCGQNGIGKKTFALELTKLLNCSTCHLREGGDPELSASNLDSRLRGNDTVPTSSIFACGTCRNCLDIDKGNFPDLIVVRSGEDSVAEIALPTTAVGAGNEGGISYNIALPDLKTGDELKDKHEIEIFQMRRAQDFLSLKSYYGGVRVVIVDNAEKMSVESQNCFLKTLEEPKGNTIIILISSQPERLLSTIFSRCQIIKFFANKEILKMANSPEKQKQENEILNDVQKILGGSLAEKFAYTKNLKEDPSTSSGQVAKVKEILEILQKYFRDLLLQKTDGKEIKYSTEKLVKIIRLIESLILKLSLTNASPKLALEILLMEID